MIHRGPFEAPPGTSDRLVAEEMAHIAQTHPDPAYAHAAAEVAQRHLLSMVQEADKVAAASDDQPQEGNQSLAAHCAILTAVLTCSGSANEPADEDSAPVPSKPSLTTLMSS